MASERTQNSKRFATPADPLLPMDVWMFGNIDVQLLGDSPPSERTSLEEFYMKFLSKSEKIMSKKCIFAVRGLWTSIWSLFRESSSRVDGSIENEVSRERKRSRNRSWGMQMTSQEPRREPRASRRSPRDVPSAHLGNSTAFWAHFRSKTWNRDDPKSVSKAEAGGRVLLRRLHTSAESDEICFDV